MRILVGCEESGKVRDACIMHGHIAYSNDLVAARNGGPHLQMCVKKAIVEHGPWDIIILHPDCTEMAVCANRWYGRGEGLKKRKAAIEWTLDLWNLAKKHARFGVVLENPASVIWSYLKNPQYVQPWEYGHKETKKTGLKIYGLPSLVPTDVVGPPPSNLEERKSWERVWRMAKSNTRKRDRSETFDGIADAIADQLCDLDKILEGMMR